MKEKLPELKAATQTKTCAQMFSAASLPNDQKAPCADLSAPRTSIMPLRSHSLPAALHACREHSFPGAFAPAVLARGSLPYLLQAFAKT